MTPSLARSTLEILSHVIELRSPEFGTGLQTISRQFLIFRNQNKIQKSSRKKNNRQPTQRPNFTKIHRIFTGQFRPRIFRKNEKNARNDRNDEILKDFQNFRLHLPQTDLIFFTAQHNHLIY